jgi:hypothetical protein
LINKKAVRLKKGKGRRKNMAESLHESGFYDRIDFQSQERQVIEIGMKSQVPSTTSNIKEEPKRLRVCAYCRVSTI